MILWSSWTDSEVSEKLAEEYLEHANWNVEAALDKALEETAKSHLEAKRMRFRGLKHLKMVTFHGFELCFQRL